MHTMLAGNSEWLLSTQGQSLKVSCVSQGKPIFFIIFWTYSNTSLLTIKKGLQRQSSFSLSVKVIRVCFGMASL